MTAQTSAQVSSLAIRQMLERLRRRPIALLAGCGCAMPATSISLRDFEEALAFHIQTRWQLSPGGSGNESDLDQLIDAIEQRVDDRDRILHELHNSLQSYAQQCSLHRFRAELAE